MQGLLITSDLFLSSQIVGQARQAGVDLEVASQLREPATGSWCIVILDLESPGADPAAIANDPRLQGAKLLAYGPHVQAALFEAASAAGFETAPRSQMSAATASLIRGLLGGA